MTLNHAINFSSLVFKLLPDVMAVGLMLAVSICILYKSPLKHYRPGIVFLMLGMLLLIPGLAVIFSHILPYRLSRWMLLPSGIIFVCAALLMVLGAYQTSKRSEAAKQVEEPNVEEEATTWPPPPKHSTK